MSRRIVHAPHALDVASFCRDGATLQGQWPLIDLPRLAESVLRGTDAPVQWTASGSVQRARGETRGQAHCQLHLLVHATVALQCQRCLQAMPQRLAIERDFHFVKGEDEAARLDEEEPEVDVLALEVRFDLRALIEDELLLALPLVPRHGSCPDLPAELRPDADAGAGDEATAPDATAEHPFAALAALRRTKS